MALSVVDNMWLLKYMLQASSLCRFKFSFNSIQMFDGSFTEESSLGRVCGDVIPVNIKTVSNLLFLEFYSDDSITYGGFKVSYQHTEGKLHGYHLHVEYILTTLLLTEASILFKHIKSKLYGNHLYVNFISTTL